MIENHPFPLMNHNPVKEAKQQGRGNSGHARSRAVNTNRTNDGFGSGGSQKRRFSSNKPKRG